MISLHGAYSKPHSELCWGTQYSQDLLLKELQLSSNWQAYRDVQIPTKGSEELCRELGYWSLYWAAGSGYKLGSWDLSNRRDCTALC